MTIKYHNVYIKDTYTIAGIYENNGPLKKYFDQVYDKDLYYGCNTFEAAESKMLKDSVKALLRKTKLSNQEVDYLISGDLQNQISSSNYAFVDINIPFFGVYNACATFGESLIIAANFVEGKIAKNVIAATSSHNMVAERQFRNPTEYGAPKKQTSTFTATGAASLLLTSQKTKIKLTSSTTGIVMDAGIKDVNHMGAVMAMAAADTIKRHLKDLNLSPDYYDLILTGDLGKYGQEILIDYLKESQIDISKNHNDCGLMLYDINHQDVYAGASGPVTSALVLSSYILKELQSGKYKRVLIVPTGAIFSPTRVFQKASIPSIAHAVSIEVVTK